jgi:aspartate kinase
MSQAAQSGEQARAVVLKFGGTSVEDASALRRVIGIVSRQAGPALVVVSALAGVTDQLLAAGEQAGGGRLAAAEEKLQALRERHERMARELLASAAAETYVSYLQGECEALAKLLQGVAALREFSARTSDRLVGAGELLSSRLLTEALREAGSDAVWVDARECIVTDDAYGCAKPLRQETDRRWASWYCRYWHKGAFRCWAASLGRATRARLPLWAEEARIFPPPWWPRG